MESVWLDGERGLTEKIKAAMYNVCKEYLYIGFLLDEAKKYEYYKDKDYKDIYDYARQELGFKKSSVINFIAVFNEFALDQKGIKTMFLRDEYKNFKYSQLCEMLSLSDKQRALVTPDTPVRAIRKLKKSDQTSGQVIQLFECSQFSVSLPVSLADRVSAFAVSSGVELDVIFSKAIENYLNAVSVDVKKMG